MNLSYWQRRVDQLREEYRKREKFLNPISETSSKPSSEEIEELIEEKLKELLKSEAFQSALEAARRGQHRVEGTIKEAKERVEEKETETKREEETMEVYPVKFQIGPALYEMIQRYKKREDIRGNYNQAAKYMLRDYCNEHLSRR